VKYRTVYLPNTYPVGLRKTSKISVSVASLWADSQMLDFTNLKQVS